MRVRGSAECHRWRCKRWPRDRPRRTLHLLPAEEAQVTASLAAAALALGPGNGAEVFAVVNYAIAEACATVQVRSITSES